MSSAKAITGSCLCGSVKYVVNGDPVMQVLCHCITCKKASGSTFMANTLYKSDQIKITAGEASIKKYTDTTPSSGAVAHRSFCTECGSPLFITNSNHPENTAVTRGSVDQEPDAAAWAPQMEFYCKRRDAWLGDAAGADPEKRFPELF
ncbi:hypothetical protein BP6252_07804 [Coleophoma cylindrospora]|uniref:CENP-V/GFA domain-containing protein n=1 Tax=Coleophoma cylindrospora TaxID=1849047 RepID=A0A3D8RBI6_9HELO|nr:hypothetical protein BP6252_07804 [Coleophoma cylindrospora]